MAFLVNKATKYIRIFIEYTHANTPPSFSSTAVVGEHVRVDRAIEYDYTVQVTGLGASATKLPAHFHALDDQASSSDAPAATDSRQDVTEMLECDNNIRGQRGPLLEQAPSAAPGEQFEWWVESNAMRSEEGHGRCVRCGKRGILKSNRESACQEVKYFPSLIRCVARGEVLSQQPLQGLKDYDAYVAEYEQLRASHSEIPLRLQGISTRQSEMQAVEDVEEMARALLRMPSDDKRVHYLNGRGSMCVRKARQGWSDAQ